MDETYVVLAQDSFHAFWDLGRDTGIRIFNPGAFYERHFDVPWSLWDTVKHAMQEHETVFPDIVNLAAASLQEKRIFIDKSAVKLSQNKPGIYFPRLWRGTFGGGNYMQFNAYNPIDCRATYGNSFVQSLISSSSMFTALQEIFRYIEPNKINMNVFSHRLSACLGNGVGVIQALDVDARAAGPDGRDRPKDKALPV